MTDKDKSNKFHFKNEMTVGHILQMIALGIPILFWGMNVEKRLSILEVRQELIIEQILDRLDKIEDKIE